MSETGSQVSWDEFSDSRCVSPALSCDFDINDTSWADTSMSPGSEVSSPEPTTTSSIWARFNSGISRFTLDLGKTTSSSSAPNSIPSIQVSRNNPAAGGGVVPPRDDVIEGAECETAKSEPSETGSWSLPQSFRKFSLGLTQSVGTKSQSSDAAADSEWLGSKLLVRSHSSNMLNENCGGCNSAEERDESRSASPSAAEAVAVTTPSGSMTGVLSHSHSGPFMQLPSSEVVPALSLDSPARLASKPPLPQRSGTMSPRDMPSRPRLTHRRSQSLQQFTPTSGNLTCLTDRRTEQQQHAAETVAENNATPSAEMTTSDLTAGGTREIFV